MPGTEGGQHNADCVRREDTDDSLLVIRLDCIQEGCCGGKLRGGGGGRGEERRMKNRSIGGVVVWIINIPGGLMCTPQVRQLGL